MKLLEIYAEEFGKLRDRRFAPGEGLTLIEGPNESGKSTLLALIRFLFYGFSQRNTGEREEREKRLSWYGRCAVGQVRFIAGGEEYLLTRRHTAGTRASETVSLTRLPGGERVDTGELSPGEYFWGLPIELFDNSVCVRQSDIDRVGAPDVREAVGSVLFSGEGDFSIEAAEKRLDAARRALQLNRGRGGKIADLEDRLSAVRTRLTTAREQAQSLAEEQAKERYYTGVVNADAEALRAVNAQLEAADLDRQLAACEDRRAAHEATVRAENALREAEAAITAQNLPQAAFFGTVDDLLGKYDGAGQTLALAAQRVQQLHEAHETPENAEVHRTAVWIEEQGGPEKVAQNYARLRAKRKHNLIAAVLLFVLAAGAAAFALLPVLAPYIFIAAGVLAAGGVAALCLSLSYRKRAAALWDGTGAPAGAKLDVYLTRLTVKDQNGQDDGAALLRVDLEFESAKERRAALQKEILDAFPAAGQARPADIDEAREHLTQLRAAVKEADEKRGPLRLAWERAIGAETALGRNTAPVDEPALRARREKLPTPTESVEQLKRRRDELQSAWNEAERGRQAAERAVTGLSATAEDPDELERDQVRLQGQLEKARADLAAVNMAAEAMQEAGQALRDGVIPQVSDDASAIFATLTGGAYEGLRVGEGFAVSLDTPNGPQPIGRFSLGCCDAAYLSLRLALLKTLSAEKLPLLFDEALSRLDDERAAALMAVLDRYVAEGGQVLLFTCHKRERQMTVGRPDVVCLSLAP